MRSFVELTKHVFTIPGVILFLSNRLCQDPIENFFGQQRQRGGTHSNPNVLEFMRNTQESLKTQLVGTLGETVRDPVKAETSWMKRIPTPLLNAKQSTDS